LDAPRALHGSATGRVNLYLDEHRIAIWLSGIAADRLLRCEERHSK